MIKKVDRTICPECGNEIKDKTLLKRIKERFFTYKLRCPACNSKLWRAATGCQGQSDWYCKCGVQVIINNPHFCPYCGVSFLNYKNTFKCGEIYKKYPL